MFTYFLIVALSVRQENLPAFFIDRANMQLYNEMDRIFQNIFLLLFDVTGVKNIIMDHPY